MYDQVPFQFQIYFEADIITESMISPAWIGTFNIQLTYSLKE